MTADGGVSLPPHFHSPLFMAAPTKNQKIEALVKLVQRRCRGAGLPKPFPRTVLQTLMYAAVFENATFDKADLAYAVLENYYIDWNEVRVCSVRELADTLIDLPHPEAAAARVRKALQGIFEKTYMFELEDLRKKGKALAEHVKTLESMSAGTPYMIQYVSQMALDGNVIPLDEASLRVMRRLGLTQVSSDGTQEVCLGLDRVILKKSCVTFAAQLHHFAAGYYDVPDSPELLSFLSAIDPAAVARSWAPPALTPPALTQPSSSPQPAAPVASASIQETKAPSPQRATPADKPKVPSKKTPSAELKTPSAELKTPSAEKPTDRSPGESVKPVAAAPRTPTKESKAVPVKKVVQQAPPKKEAPPKKAAPKKPLKSPPPTRKAALKETPSKPVKTPKAVSPSKVLRKQKPK